MIYLWTLNTFSSSDWLVRVRAYPMKNLLVPGIVAAALCGAPAFAVTPAKAATMEDVMAKLNSLAKENAALRQRVENLEGSKRVGTTRTNAVVGSIATSA